MRALLAALLLSGTALAQVAAPSSSFTLGGAVASPRTFTLAELRALPARELTLTFTSGGRPETHRYKGALLYDLLQAARPQLAAGAKNDALRFVILARASDGYAASFSWGELDPGFGKREVLVAYEQDGQPLPEAQGALRLVVPGDEKGGRYVSDLTDLTVVRLQSP